MSFQKISLSADLNLVWPSNFSLLLALCDLNQVTPLANGYSITLPDVTAPGSALGFGGEFNNVSTFTFFLKAYGQSSTLFTISPGQVVRIYVDNVADNATGWKVIFPPSVSAITALGISSSNSSVLVSGGNVSSPGGQVNLSLPTSFTNLTQQITSPGFAVISSVNPLTWKSVDLVAGGNINISNPSGVSGEPVISLSSSISAISSVEVGDITISGSVIDVNRANSSLSISSNGTGKVYINGLGIDTNANLSGINNLSISGNFSSPFSTKGWAFFTDTLITGSNEISIKSQAGIASITGNSGNYIINFASPLSNLNYAVFISPMSTDKVTPLVTSGYAILKTLSSVTIVVVDAGGEKVASVPQGISVMILAT